MSEEKKTDWGGIAVVGAILVGAYLLTRKVEAAPTPTEAPTQPPLYQSGQGYTISTPREQAAPIAQTVIVGEQKSGTVSEPKWTDPTQAPLFHFDKYPAGVPPQSGQVVGVQVPRPWAGVTGEGLFEEATKAPLYWNGPPETAGLILVPERYRPIIEKYGIDVLRAMRSPADPAYAEIEKQYGRETANLMIRYALELSNGVARGYTVEYVTKEHMKILSNKVDERFLADWVLGASVTHPGGDPGTVKTRAAQMKLSEEEYKYVALRYFYELHGYIPDQYKIVWATLDPKYHDTWKGFPKGPLPRTYTSLSGLTYTLEEYKKVFGTVPWDKPILLRPGYYLWRDPQRPGSIQTGSMDDYKKSMANAEKAKGKLPVEKPIEARIPEKKEKEISREQGAKNISTHPAKTPLSAEKPPQSTPTNPRATQTTRAAVASQQVKKEAATRQVITQTLQAINRATPGPRRG